MTIKYLYYIHKLNTFITATFLCRHLALAMVLRVFVIYPCPVFTRVSYLHAQVFLGMVLLRKRRSLVTSEMRVSQRWRSGGQDAAVQPAACKLL